MGTLSLLEDLAGEFFRLGIQWFSLEELRVSQNGSQRVVQFVRYARDELADCRHLRYSAAAAPWEGAGGLSPRIIAAPAMIARTML